MAERVGTGGPTWDDATGRVVVPVGGDGSSALTEMIRGLDAESIRIADLALRRPTLDDVFLALTGHAAEDGTEPAGEPVKVGAR